MYKDHGGMIYLVIDYQVELAQYLSQQQNRTIRPSDRQEFIIIPISYTQSFTRSSHLFMQVNRVINILNYLW